MAFDSRLTADLRSTLPTGDAAHSVPSFGVPPPVPLLASLPAPTRRTRPSPPRLNLPDSAKRKPNESTRGETLASPAVGGNGGRPALFVQPASPAMSTDSPTFNSNNHDVSIPPPSPSYANQSFPSPIPSTSTSTHNGLSSSPPPLSPISPSNGSSSNPFPLPLAPPSPGGGLAARRAAKLGKKTLSLVVPTSNHVACTNASSSSSALLSPTTPSSLLRPNRSSTLNIDGEDSSSLSLLLEASETRSLPPSPVSLQTFIGAEGSEAPDRTIGRLMLKQQADEMREQMRGGRGMKRRTSIPRLNLNPNATTASNSTGSARTSPVKSVSGSSSAKMGERGTSSAVQFLRREGSGDSRAGESVVDDEELEEFPYEFGPREILPGIFLGSEQNAKDPRILQEWNFGFVLNVAKEVDCPWVDELNSEEEEVEGDLQQQRKSSPARPKSKHRRTKTQQAIDPRSSSVNPTSPSEARPVRPLFIRPTASTPNLQSVFQSASTSPPEVPPIPSIPPIPITTETGEKMLRSLSSSPPTSLPRRSPPRVRIHPITPHGDSTKSITPRMTPSTCQSKGVVRFPRNRSTGRPGLEYLWLKWGHDEADLVEAQKFQQAFDFLDEARSRNEKVLVHCQCGVSRSATVVIAYCMREAAKALEEGRDAKELSGCTGMHDTYSFVKEKSEWVGPNLGLVFQLVAYERTLRGDSNDLGEDEEPEYPHYPPEPVEDDSSSALKSPSVDPPNGSFAFPLPLQSPHTPVSLDGSISRSESSTPDLHHPLSPTFSNGTQSSSANTTPLSLQLPNHAKGLPAPYVVNEETAGHEGGIESRHRHSSVETLKGEPQVFVLSPPPDRVSHPDQESPYPSPAPSPLEMPARNRNHRPPSLKLNGRTPELAKILVPSPTTIVSSPTLTPTLPEIRKPSKPTPSASLPALTTTGLPALSPPRLSSDQRSPGSALTTSSSDSNGTSTTLSPSTGLPNGATTSSGGKKFGAQSRSERRASHRRVFSETISVPGTIQSSWSSHSLHSIARDD